MFADLGRGIVIPLLCAVFVCARFVRADYETTLKMTDEDVEFNEGYSEATTKVPPSDIASEEATQDSNELPDDFGLEPDFGSPKFDGHMRQTIADEFGEPVPEDYTGKAYYYYYFKTHDEDKNGKLDKTELLKALIHLVLPGSSYSNNHNRGDDFKERDGDYGVAWEIELLVRDSVDRIMRKDDKNRDGFIDHLEYQDGKSRGIKAIKKSIDKQLKEHGGRFY